jgi:anti-anti-sigma factor
MPDLSIESRGCPGVPQAVEAAVKGRFSSTSVAYFKSSIDALLVGKPCILLLGLEGIDFLPSITLSYLAHLFERLEPRGGTLCLVGIELKVKIVLSQLGLDALFEFRDSFDDARVMAAERVKALKEQPRLLVLRGIGEGQQYPIRDTALTVGSDPACTIPVKAALVAPKHAEFIKVGADCRVRNIDAKMGTFVGKQKVAQEALKSGDVIRIGEFELQYLAPGEAAPVE